MPSLSDPDLDIAKIMLIGDSGHGKSGAKASLIATGMKYRGFDTDNGRKILKALLTSTRYPYAEYMRKHKIDPFEPGRVSFVPIEVLMEFDTVSVKRRSGTLSYGTIKPTGVGALSRLMNFMKEWKDEDINLGPVTDWDNNVVLDLDTLSSLAEIAKYWSQDMNGHLGAFEDDHGRDSGTSQELMMRLSRMLSSGQIKCNVIVTTHVRKVDMSLGAPQSPEQLLRERQQARDSGISGGVPFNPRGYPQVIGNAASPFIGKHWNDIFIVRRTGDGHSTERRIYTMPTDNIDAKNSVWLEPSYPLSTGLAEIFAALQYKEPPHDLIEHVKKFEQQKSTTTATAEAQPRVNNPFMR